MTTLGERLTNLDREVLWEALRARTAAGASVNGLAKAVGLSQPRLRAFLRGEGDLTLRTAAKLCGYLELELREGRPDG